MSIVYEFSLNPAKCLREIAFGAVSIENPNDHEILNMTDGATCSTTYTLLPGEQCVQVCIKSTQDSRINIIYKK